MVKGLNMIKIDLDKAKEKVAHPLRRQKRSAEFKKVDGDIMYTSLTSEGEAKRKDIKANDDVLQVEIDKASSLEELETLLKKSKLL